MDISAWDIYWITRLDFVCNLAQVMIVVLGFTTTLLTVGIAMAHFVGEEEEEKMKVFKPWLKRLSLSLLFFITIYLMVPRTIDAAGMIVVPKILNSELVQEDVSAEAKELYSIFKRWAEQQVEERKDDDNL